MIETPRFAPGLGCPSSIDGPINPARTTPVGGAGGVLAAHVGPLNRTIHPIVAVGRAKSSAKGEPSRIEIALGDEL